MLFIMEILSRISTKNEKSGENILLLPEVGKQELRFILPIFNEIAQKLNKKKILF